MSKILGIDGGGSRSVALLSNGDNIEWTHESGSLNISRVKPDIFEQTFNDLVKDCKEPDSICVGLAGLLDSDQKSFVQRMIQNRFGAIPVLMVPDFEIALEACGSQVQICVISGTGSLVCSRNNENKLRKTGGRGFVLGDEGSGFQFGREALLHFLDSPPDDVSSELVVGVNQIFGTMNREEVVAKCYSLENMPLEISKLAKIVSSDAQKSQLYALKAMRIHFGKLAHLVSIHIRKFHEEEKILVVGCQGGMWNSQVFRDGFEEQLRFWCGDAIGYVDFEVESPVKGAIRLGRRLLA